MTEEYNRIIKYKCDKCKLHVEAIDTATVWCPKGHLMEAQD